MEVCFGWPAWKIRIIDPALSVELEMSAEDWMPRSYSDINKMYTIDDTICGVMEEGEEEIICW